MKSFNRSYQFLNNWNYCFRLFRKGVIIGADTRSIMGTIITKKNWLKVTSLTYKIMKNIFKTIHLMWRWNVGRFIESYGYKVKIGDRVPIVAAFKIVQQYLFSYQGHIDAYLIIWEDDTDYLLFITNGYVFLAFMSYFDSNY
ncbi:hypothetical protein HZS_7835 [Henneguya salminicola]|nr:hypothetical protein HZS_7835 [Henneguya salminicola]